MGIRLGKRVVDGVVVGLTVSIADPSGALDHAELDQFVANSPPSNPPWGLDYAAISESTLPLGHDPSGCLPSNPLGVSIRGGDNIAVSEDGESIRQTLFLTGTADRQLTYELRSSNPSEGQVLYPLKSFPPGANCTGINFEIVGLNDGEDDGDQRFEIQVIDEQGGTQDQETFINIDNDLIPDVGISITLPRAIVPGKPTRVSVRIDNRGSGELLSHRLLIHASETVLIESAQCSLLSNDECVAPDIDVNSERILIPEIDLPPEDSLLITIDVSGSLGQPFTGPGTAALSASLSGPLGSPTSDNIGITSIALFGDGFEEQPN